MKRICLILLCLGSTVSIFGQLKTITKEKYDTARDNAFKETGKVLRRVITVTVKYKASKIASTETLTKESFPNGDERWNLVTKRDGQIIDKLQLIYLGKYEYRKEGESDWKKSCFKDCSTSETSGQVVLTAREIPKVQEFLITDTTVSGQPATMYLFFRVYQFGATLNFYQSNIWIGSNGLILKEESATSDVFPTNLASSETVSYEYNPKDVVPLSAPVNGSSILAPVIKQ